MLRKHMAACLTVTTLMAGALAAAPASAQTTAPAPGATAQTAAGKFLTQQSATHWRASKLVGLNVYSHNNERIGDVNEVLVDRNGNVDAVVIGVGGFLGIGEKDVAVPFRAVEWRMNAAANRPVATSAPADGTPVTTPGGAPVTGSGTTTTGSTAAADANRGYPDHAVLAMSKADLQNAPAFRYAGSTAANPPAANPPKAQ